MKALSRWFLVCLVAIAAGCTNNDPEAIRIDFRQSPQGWIAGFADYPVGQDAFYELESDYRALEAPLDPALMGLYITGNNHSDDLWMYYKGRIAGLDADRQYSVRFEVEIATRVPNGCVGVGGAPGESVTVKAGASNIEPQAIVEGSDWRMNIDKGNQTNGGANAVVIGDMANSIPCGEEPQWELKQLSSGTESIRVTTDGTGAAWLFVGTDSGFEATTSVYYTWVLATFEP